jgi:F0F1-type ATP synthase membrane subunit b/b'
MKADADARAAEIDRKIASLSSEVEALRRGSREEMNAEAARVRAETEQHLTKIQAQAEAEIAAAAKTASQGLKAHAAELALKLAEDQLRGRLGPQDQNALVRSFVRNLDANGKASLS